MIGHPRLNGSWTVPNGSSTNGNVVVGFSYSGPLLGASSEAFAWTQNGGFTILPVPSSIEQPSVSATGVNADGTIIIGRASDGITGDAIAIRWVNGMPHDLGNLPLYMTHVNALDISGDGNIVTGRISGEGMPDRSFVWTADTGMMFANDYFASFGLVLPAVIREIGDVSADGSTYAVKIEGSASALVIVIPSLSGGPCDWSPLECPSDYDGDTDQDSDDILAFFQDWDIGNGCADVDGDADQDSDDIIHFFTAWDLGQCRP